MAFLENLICNKCGTTWNGVRRKNQLYQYCYECEKILCDTKKKKWLLDRRNKKTIKQRIEWIEDWIYKNKDKIHNSYVTDRFY
jgi:hypothetical protein